jgi:hypothetical protein
VLIIAAGSSLYLYHYRCAQPRIIATLPVTASSRSYIAALLPLPSARCILVATAPFANAQSAQSQLLRIDADFCSENLSWQARLASSPHIGPVLIANRPAIPRCFASQVLAQTGPYSFVLPLEEPDSGLSRPTFVTLAPCGSAAAALACTQDSTCFTFGAGLLAHAAGSRVFLTACDGQSQVPLSSSFSLPADVNVIATDTTNGAVFVGTQTGNLYSWGVSGPL